MSNATQIAWAAVRECNEALKAADAIVAMEFPEGWHMVYRGDWVEYSRCLDAVAKRHELVETEYSIFRTYHNELIIPDNYGKISTRHVDETLKKLQLRHAQLMMIYEETK